MLVIEMEIDVEKQSSAWKSFLTVGATNIKEGRPKVQPIRGTSSRPTDVFIEYQFW